MLSKKMKFNADEVFKDITNKTSEKLTTEVIKKNASKPSAGGIEKKESLVTSIEKRDYRTSILIKKSVHKNAVLKAKKMGISFNEVINQLLEKFIAE